MEPNRMVHDRDTMQSDYNHLLTLWTSGVRDYHHAVRTISRPIQFSPSSGLLVSRESLVSPSSLSC